MPTSDGSALGFIADKILEIQPKSILDIGVGFGSKGAIFRELTDVRNLRYFKEEWTTKIDGIEVFETYISQHHKYLYDTIHIGDATKVIDSLGNYDFVFWGDCIEHIYKDKALELLEKLKKKAKHIVISTPNGFYAQGAVFGNENERHVSAWSPEDFSGFEIRYFGILMVCSITNNI